MRRTSICLAASSLGLMALASLAYGAEITVAPGTEPEVTVYSGDFGLVREHRIARLSDANSRLAFTGVSRNLQPETVTLAIGASDKVKASDVKILDQTFAFNLMSPQALLDQSVGKEVSIVTTNPATGRDATERAKVISVQNGVVLDIGGKIYTGLPGRVVFDSLPGNLRAVPTLLMSVTGPIGADIPIEFSYLTNGLGWHADYVANYDGEAGRLDLTGWATVSNTTGVEFKDAKLKLAAGSVNRVAPQPPRPVMRAAAMTASSAPQAAEAGSMTPQGLSGLNIYTLGRPVTLSSGENKQFVLMRAVNVPVKRDYVVEGQPAFYTGLMPVQRQAGSVEIELSLKNEGRVKVPKAKVGEGGTEGLGVPLPAGVVRAYGQDNDGAPQFLGEDRIDHIVEGGDIRLRLGGDADLPVVREQISFVHASDVTALSVWRISLRNAKARAVTVRIAEPVPGNWDVIKENVAHTKNAAGAAEWNVTVPAKGEATLEYTVKTTL